MYRSMSEMFGCSGILFLFPCQQLKDIIYLYIYICGDYFEFYYFCSLMSVKFRIYFYDNVTMGTINNEFDSSRIKIHYGNFTHFPGNQRMKQF